MKKRSDPRHLRRIKNVKELFAWQFQPNIKVSPKLSKTISKLSEIDSLIQKSAPSRPIEQINKIDLAILRLSVFELIMIKGVPPKVVIDEAVELGKQYGSDSSASFINGALGKLVEIRGIKT